MAEEQRKKYGADFGLLDSCALQNWVIAFNSPELLPCWCQISSRRRCWIDPSTPAAPQPGDDVGRWWQKTELAAESTFRRVMNDEANPAGGWPSATRLLVRHQ